MNRENQFLRITRITVALLLLMSLPVFAGGRSEKEATGSLEPFTVVLDWVPNTNHTGVYTAIEKGYYREAGLEVDVVQPSESGTEMLIASGNGDVGFSHQEYVTYARTAKEPLPIKAVAAIIQHNTSGFATLPDRNIDSPKDFEGKTYGGWGTELEDAFIKAVMDKVGGDFSKVEIVNVGTTDFFGSFRQGIDFRWIFYGWDGIRAEVKDRELEYFPLIEVDPRLDYYTPVLIASESTLENRPGRLRRFLEATSRGYEFAVDNPRQAAGHLLAHADQIDPEHARASQEYLAEQYIADAPRWGVMKEEVWETFGGFMYEYGLLASRLDAQEAFTNEFLPEQ
ncbi:MAG: ABC transporter substrate-binding protein [Spirochaetales bacterium]|nr:ABC transporter substrate-binding protein [Spirochaetales bacterium]MCF7938533.1 ABC transporter substrate-binding protein [Spirochaetales bacterium]